MLKTTTLFFLCLTLLSLFGCEPVTVEPAKVGDSAPDFCLKDINDNVIILSYWKGDPIILRFWETDCMFCRADTPVFTEFYEKYRDQGLKIVYISSYYEQLKDIRSFVQQYELDFTVIMDSDGKLADLFSIDKYPKTVTISPEHQITAAIDGGVGEAELVELIGKYFE